MPLTAEQRDRLVEAARVASRSAYIPYSRFPVGAALFLESGEIISGCNVENASYGLTICAERNAVFQMAARGHRTFVAMAVYTPTQEPATSCGACRQVLNEFAPEALVISVCDGPGVIEMTVAELIPHAFGPHNLSADPGAPGVG